MHVLYSHLFCCWPLLITWMHKLLYCSGFWTLYVREEILKIQRSFHIFWFESQPLPFFWASLFHTWIGLRNDSWFGKKSTGRNLFRRSGPGWHGLGWSHVKTGIVVVIGYWHIYIPTDLYFWRSTLQNKAVWNQMSSKYSSMSTL